MNTLVEDIYKTLEPLSDGKPLDISEQQIENFGEAMKDVMRSWANPTKRDSNFSIRMSNVGKPARRLWFDSQATDKESFKTNSPTQIKFLYGHMLEELVKLFVVLSGHDVTGEQKQVVVDSITGHIDCIIDDEVVDIKKWITYNFNEIKIIFEIGTKFTKLKTIDFLQEGRHLHIRFTATTGDAMGMNMVSKSSNAVLKYLQSTILNLK